MEDVHWGHGSKERTRKKRTARAHPAGQQLKHTHDNQQSPSRQNDNYRQHGAKRQKEKQMNWMPGQEEEMEQKLQELGV